MFYFYFFNIYNFEYLTYARKTKGRFAKMKQKQRFWRRIKVEEFLSSSSTFLSCFTLKFQAASFRSSFHTQQTQQKERTSERGKLVKSLQDFSLSCRKSYCVINKSTLFTSLNASFIIRQFQHPLNFNDGREPQIL